jgi:hypothetical protein
VPRRRILEQGALLLDVLAGLFVERLKARIAPEMLMKRVVLGQVPPAVELLVPDAVRQRARARLTIAVLIGEVQVRQGLALRSTSSRVFAGQLFRLPAFDVRPRPCPGLLADLLANVVAPAVAVLEVNAALALVFAVGGGLHVGDVHQRP